MIDDIFILVQIIPQFIEVLFLLSILNQQARHSITLTQKLFHNSPTGPLPLAQHIQP